MRVAQQRQRRRMPVKRWRERGAEAGGEGAEGGQGGRVGGWACVGGRRVGEGRPNFPVVNPVRQWTINP